MNVVTAVETFSSGVVSWVEKILYSIVNAPSEGLRVGTGLVCTGIGKLDELTALDSAVVTGREPEELPRDEEGAVLVNEFLEKVKAGKDQCRRVSEPYVSTCKRFSEVYFEGEDRCVRLPEMVLSVREAEFLDLDQPVLYRNYSAELARAGPGDLREGNLLQVELSHDAQVPPTFLPTPADLSVTPRTARNVGLTRAFLDWELRWDTLVDDPYRVVDGFAVFVYPDQRSLHVPVSQGGVLYILPKFYQVEVDGYVQRAHSVNGFSVGGLNYYSDRSSLALPGSTPFYSNEFDDIQVELDPLGSPRSEADFLHLSSLLQNMPLAPGFVHSFEVAPYVGSGADFRLGPRSERIYLDGDTFACDHRDLMTDVERNRVEELYDCDRADSGLVYAEDDFRPGLLGVVGSDICRDIFTSTPAAFTWDNPVVGRAWNLMWIIAGGVLFTLLVWQGLRMTYDVWLEPQPATGFRELAPRFLLATALAVSSLVICQLALVVASDLTCFVAQFTGMSMWGVVGVTFANAAEAFFSWTESLFSSSSLLDLLGNAAGHFLLQLFVVFMLIFILFLFGKVLFGMLLRIALLAVLIAFSPLAFAFYASDATAHWTKRWVTLFLGTTFQQVVVLVVLYIGMHLIADYLATGAETGVTQLVLSLILSFLVLSLAASVPDIVNPGSKGLFSAFGQLGSMALAGGVMVVSGGIGAVAGGLGALGSGGAGAAGALGGLGGGGAAAGGVTLATGPGGAAGAAGVGGAVAGGAPGGVAAGGAADPLRSSVSRISASPALGVGGAAPPGVGPAAPAPGAGAGPAAPPSGVGASVPGAGPGVAPPSGAGPGVAPPPGAGPSVSPPSGAGAGPGGVTLATGPGGCQPAGGGAPAAGPGVFSRVLRGIGQGYMQGSRRGAGFNTRVRDFTSGNSFYRHSSRSDDAARQMERMREGAAEEQERTREAFTRLSDVMTRLEQRLP